MNGIASKVENLVKDCTKIALKVMENALHYPGDGCKASIHKVGTSSLI